MSNFGVRVGVHYKLWCYDKLKKLKWVNEILCNLVVTEGRNLLLDNTFTVPAAAVTFFVGLITGPGSGTTYAAEDLLDSHTGWVENADYAGDRKAFVPNAAASSGAISNSSSKASFAINATATLAGAFLTSAESGTTGALFGAGDFTGGDRSVEDGDTVNVQVDISITAS